MKKLNRKGFTLIELLAVIVIMAIILVVTVPNIIQSINDARVSSIHNLAVSAAKSYNNIYAQDLIVPNPDNRTLGKIPEKITDSWQCIGNLKTGVTTGTPLAEILGFNEADLVLTGTVPAGTNAAMTSTQTDSITVSNCSAIRIRNGVAEVVLVAANGGRFYVAQKHTYALSTATAGGQNAITTP